MAVKILSETKFEDIQVGDRFPYPLEDNNSDIIEAYVQVTEQIYLSIVDQIPQNQVMVWNKILHIIDRGDGFFNGIYQHDFRFYIVRIEG